MLPKTSHAPLGSAQCSSGQTGRIHYATGSTDDAKFWNGHQTLCILLNVMRAVERPLAELYFRKCYSCCLRGLREESFTSSRAACKCACNANAVIWNTFWKKYKSRKLCGILTHKLKLLFTKYHIIRWTRVKVNSIFVDGILFGSLCIRGILWSPVNIYL